MWIAARTGGQGLLVLAASACLAAACGPGEPPPFDGGRSMADVKAQVAFGPRIPGTEAHRRCADWLVARLQETTEHVRRQSFLHVPPVPSEQQSGRRPDTVALHNIIASFSPDQTSRITLCAHWDSRPRADEDPDSTRREQPVPGANDGASGVAVCLEMARIMAAVPPPIGVDIVLFDGEDQGRQGQLNEYLLGSRWFINRAPNYRPKAVILLDMIGDRDLDIVREGYSDSLAPMLTDLVWETAARVGLSAFRDSVGIRIIDDHLPFLLAGIPAVDLIDFDYAFWHTVEDTPDKVAPESLATLGALLTELLYRTPAERFDTRVVVPETPGP